jgi:hypothetical protein
LVSAVRDFEAGLAAGRALVVRALVLRALVLRELVLRELVLRELVVREGVVRDVAATVRLAAGFGACLAWPEKL